MIPSNIYIDPCFSLYRTSIGTILESGERLTGLINRVSSETLRATGVLVPSGLLRKQRTKERC